MQILKHNPVMAKRLIAARRMQTSMEMATVRTRAIATMKILESFLVPPKYAMG
jgi:hypothetical protein